MTYLSFSVTHDEDRDRADRIIHRRWPHIPYHSLQAAFRKGFFRSEKKAIRPQQRLPEGFPLQVWAPFVQGTPTADAERPQSLSSAQRKSSPDTDERLWKVWRERVESWILWQDDFVIALNKPSGIATQGGTGQKISIDRLMNLFAAQSFPAGSARLVHRLDKETSGVLLIARSLKAAQMLTRAFAEHRVEKYYWAIVCGRMHAPKGVLNSPLARSSCPSNPKVSVLPSLESPSKAQEALTLFRERSSWKHNGYTLSWLDLNPKTGRMHQLRAHLSDAGCPILGDSLYGKRIPLLFPSARLQLHCYKLIFPHPESLLPVEIYSPPPPSFLRKPSLHA